VKIAFCGVRGSTPSPGARYARYGGHTSCVAIADDGQVPTLVLDAGTGLRALTELLEGAPFRGTLLLGHLHWDHTQGLPFFPSGDRPDAEVALLAPAQDGPLLDVLTEWMSPPHFPVTPAELRGRWTFEGLDSGEHAVEGFTVLALEIPHKGGRTFGYRISDGAATVAYLSDHAPQLLGEGPHGFGELHEAARRLADGADLLIHDSQYTSAELPVRGAFGHAAWEYAVELGVSAGARRVALFHHDPARADDEVDAIAAAAVERAGSRIEVFAAREGSTVEL
jgi:phosphoribosyl 1,2-cyclic phosphodiesterase